MQKSVVIVAGGKGTRMKSAIPKQFLLLGNKPVILHTIEAFRSYSEELNIILVLPEADIKKWHEIEDENNLSSLVKICTGGQTRFQSVRAGLKLVDSGVVAIHDGVRPLVSRDVIDRTFSSAVAKGSGIAAVALKESIRETKGSEASEAKDRSRYKLVQTPQTFQTDLIKRAYEQKEQSFFTDCASVAEASGYDVFLVESEYTNLKITGLEDLIIAEALLKHSV